MLAALLLFQAAPVEAATPAEAERAFASMAAREGQWRAFRHFSTPDAVMFDPQPVNAHALLRDLPEPRVAVQWWAADSYVSCDGALAVNTGPWVRAGGSQGFFTTVWQRQPGGAWRWVMDGGDTLAAPRPAGDGPRIRTAACTGSPPDIGFSGDSESVRGARYRSPDRTLVYFWFVGREGGRSASGWIWTGARYEKVIDERIAAPLAPTPAPTPPPAR